MLRQQLFVYWDLWTWIDTPFQLPPALPPESLHSDPEIAGQHPQKMAHDQRRQEKGLIWTALGQRRLVHSYPLRHHCVNLAHYQRRLIALLLSATMEASQLRLVERTGAGRRRISFLSGGGPTSIQGRRCSGMAIHRLRRAHGNSATRRCAPSTHRGLLWTSAWLPGRGVAAAASSRHSRCCPAVKLEAEVCLARIPRAVVPQPRISSLVGRPGGERSGRPLQHDRRAQPSSN